VSWPPTSCTSASITVSPASVTRLSPAPWCRSYTQLVQLYDKYKDQVTGGGPGGGRGGSTGHRERNTRGVGHHTGTHRLRGNGFMCLWGCSLRG
jgi:hypothetical protein